MRAYPEGMATIGRPFDDVGLSDLMTHSPESQAHMSAVAQTTFLLGLGALLTSPFSPLFAVTLLLGAAAFLSGIVGMITTRAPELAGSALSAVGMFGGLLAAGLVGLRYLGLDTAFGDAFAPWLFDQIQTWNSHLPQPG